MEHQTEEATSVSRILQAIPCGVCLPSLGDVMVFTLIFSLQGCRWHGLYAAGFSEEKHSFPCLPVILCMHWMTRDCIPLPQVTEHWGRWRRLVKSPVCRCSFPACEPPLPGLSWNWTGATTSGVDAEHGLETLMVTRGWPQYACALWLARGRALGGAGRRPVETDTASGRAPLAVDRVTNIRHALGQTVFKILISSL